MTSTRRPLSEESCSGPISPTLIGEVSFSTKTGGVIGRRRKNRAFWSADGDTTYTTGTHRSGGSGSPASGLSSTPNTRTQPQMPGSWTRLASTSGAAGEFGAALTWGAGRGGGGPPAPGGGGGGAGAAPAAGRRAGAGGPGGGT